MHLSASILLPRRLRTRRGPERAEPDHLKGRFKKDEQWTVAELTYKNRHELRKLARKMETQRDPVRLEKLKRSSEIKNRFLAMLMKG